MAGLRFLRITEARRRHVANMWQIGYSGNPVCHKINPKNSAGFLVVWGVSLAAILRQQRSQRLHACWREWEVGTVSGLTGRDQFLLSSFLLTCGPAHAEVDMSSGGARQSEER